jgi:CheY-like chemotaxis protein
MGDSARLNQILTNLLTNAFQHTDDGMVNSSVTVQEQTQKEVLLKIVVEDNDDNPDRVNLDDAFKPWKKNVADFEGYDGKYLSLVITKRLIELQNGKLVVENKPGYGTAFIAYLPFKLSLQPAQKKEERAASSFGYLSGSRILVVEDNKINQLVVAKMLRKLGIEVTTADNGLEALKIYNEEEFDLVLMDIQMPEMDGYRTTAEIRRHFDPAKREVPIIALTASAFLTEKEKARLFGMNDHVGKPFSPEELLEKISTCLKIRKNA